MQTFSKSRAHPGAEVAEHCGAGGRRAADVELHPLRLLLFAGNLLVAVVSARPKALRLSKGQLEQIEKRETKNRFYGRKEGRCAYVPGMQRVAPLLSQQLFLEFQGRDENQGRETREGEKPGRELLRTTPCGRPWSRGPPRSGS